MDSASLATAGDIAAALVGARRSRRPLDAFPGPMPQSMDEGYRIQEAGLALWADDVVGWKIGLVPAHLRPALQAERLAGPIFAKDLRQAKAGEVVEFPVYVGGFAAVEAEFVFRMAADAPAGKTDWTDDEAAALVAALHIGVETAGSPMRMINDLGSAVVSADFGNNYGLILGPAIADWRTHMNDVVATTSIEGQRVGEGRAASIPGGPLAGLRFLLTHLAQRNRPLRAGQLVSTGAVTGVHDILAGQNATLSFPPAGEILCRAVAA
jgi:2-keto-4-pentenoate hydratase